MENKVFFSIIIPTYNRGHLISKTIRSIIMQNFTYYEIIIVDDGSTDNTEDIVRPFLSKNIKYYKKNNAERGAARNYGTKLANGDYVNWFDSDDLALPNHLTSAEFFCLQLNKPEIFHLAYQYNNPNGVLLRSVSSFPNINNISLYLGNNS